MERDDVLHFKKAINGSIYYDHNHKSIIEVEDFILNWLQCQKDKTPMLPKMLLLYTELKDSFNFNGILYRGITLEKETYNNNGILPIELASFTNMKEVGLYFANASEEYETVKKPNHVCCLYEVEVTNAFAFDELLMVLQDLSNNTTLLNKIDEVIWENEKFHSFNPTTASLVSI